MTKFVHLAGKIREVRKTLGLKQDEFAEKLGASRSIVARWESPLEKNRAIPKEEYLKKMADMTSRPWETLCWFMDEGVEPGRGYYYYPDGNRTLEPVFTDEEMSQIQDQMAEESGHDSKPNPIIESMVKTPHRLNDLYNFYQELNEKEKNQSSTPPVKSIPENENIPAGKVLLTSEDAIQSNASRNLGGLVIHARQSIGDIAGGRNYKKVDDEERLTHIVNEFTEERAIGLRTERDDRREEMEMFWSAVQYNLQDAEGIDDARAFFNKRISCGAIKQSIAYLDGRTLAAHSRIDPAMSPSMIRLRLNRYLADLFMAERIQNKSYKKLMLFYVIGSGQVDTTKLKEHYAELINSAQMLGVTVEFSCGAADTAKVFGKFIRDSMAERG